jgi:rhamnulokinase
MTQEAADAKSGPLVNVDDASLLAPADMEAALTNLLKNSGQAAPENRGQLTRCVLESLALQYAWGMDRIHDLTGVKPKSLYMVGGGIANKLLCQFTANACGVPVHAAADQCTALGNALGQAMALGILRNREEIRQVMRNSFAATVYEPKEAAVWADKRALYAKLHGD